MTGKTPGGLIGLVISALFLTAVNIPFIEFREGWVCKPTFHCPVEYRHRWGESFPKKLGLSAWALVRPTIVIFDILNSERISYAESRDNQIEHERRLLTDPAYAEDFAEFGRLDFNEKIARSVEGIIESKVRWGYAALLVALAANVILGMLAVIFRREVFGAVRGLWLRIWRWF